MLNLLAILTSLSSSTSQAGTSSNGGGSTGLSWTVLIQYGVLVVIILVSLILIAVVKRALKNEASIKRTKTKTQKALDFAKAIKDKNSKKDLIIAATRLAKLAGIISDASWNAVRVSEEKKAVALDGIVSGLDSLATYVSTFAEQAFYTRKEYDEKISVTIQSLEGIIVNIDQFIKENGQ